MSLHRKIHGQSANDMTGGELRWLGQLMLLSVSVSLCQNALVSFKVVRDLAMWFQKSFVR